MQSRGQHVKHPALTATQAALTGAEERDGAPVKRPRRMEGLFANSAPSGGFVEMMLEESSSRRSATEGQLLGGRCEKGRIEALVQSDGTSADKIAEPRSGWWMLEHGGTTVGPAESPTLDLSKLGEDVAAVAFVAEVANTERRTVREPSEVATRKSLPPWEATMSAIMTAEGGSGSSLQRLVRLRRPDGVQHGGAWLVAVLTRELPGDGSGWRAEAVDEVYPDKRLKALLQLRCKELVRPGKEDRPKEEDPMEATRRMLAEAMAGK